MAKNFKFADIDREATYTVTTTETASHLTGGAEYGATETKEMTGEELYNFAQAFNHLYDIHAEKVEREQQEQPTDEQNTELVFNYEHFLTVGLFDAEAERQLISTEDARDFIAELLISKYEIDAFTMFDCFGVYRMASTGNIVKEPSIRIEIASEAQLSSDTSESIIKDLKEALNQETIMCKVVKVESKLI